MLTELTDKAVELFWARVQKSPDPDGCWLWTGGTASAGYPITYTGQGTKKTSARLFSYRLNVNEGQIGSVKPCPLDPLCVRPDHLGANYSKAQDISDERVEEIRSTLNRWLSNHRNVYARRVSMY